MGRKLKLTSNLIDTACELISAGNFDNVVFAYLGIGETSWYRWLQVGEEEYNQGKNTLLAQLYININRARAEAEIRNLNIIQESAKQDWKASAWFLERKYNARWGKKEKTELTGKDGGPVQITNAKEILIQKINNMVTKKEDDEE